MQQNKGSNRSRIVLIIVFIGTLVLAGAAIFLGYQLNQQQQVAPEESSAILNEGLLGEVHPGSSYPICSSDLRIENLAENFDSSTGSYTITGQYQNNYSQSISGNAAVFICRCREGNGNNSSGHCNGNWPENEGTTGEGLSPLEAAQFCEQIPNIDLNLGAGETRDFSIVAEQTSPTACGSFQIDVLAVRPDGQGEDPGAQLTLPSGTFSCEWQDWYHVAAVHRTGVDCAPSCESLSSDLGGSIEITAGEALSASLEPTVYDFGLASVGYNVTNGFGSVSGESWSISAGESGALSDGASGSITLTLDGAAQSSCEIPLTVSAQAVTPACNQPCTEDPPASTGFTCEGEGEGPGVYVPTSFEPEQCSLSDYLANSCQCPTVEPELSCDSLTVASGATSTSYTGGSVNLTANATGENISGNLTYTYGTDLGTVTGSGATAVWEIPSVPAGTTEVSAWVSVGGGGISAGCSDASCAQSCITTLQVTSPDCGDSICNDGETCEISGGDSFACENGSLSTQLQDGACRTTNCTYCGDGVINSGEECEPGQVNSSTGQTCSASCAWGPTPQCGSSCTSDEQCPSSMVCSSGVCRDSFCPEDSDCVCDVAPPQCGDACASDTDCPTDMTCSSANVCRRTQCPDASDCICTGLLDDSTKTPTAILIVILGTILLLMYRRGESLQKLLHIGFRKADNKKQLPPILKKIEDTRKSQKRIFEKRF